MDPAATRVVFMGSPTFARPSLRALNRAGYLIALAVTQPDRPAGRGGRVTPPPVKSLAVELGLEVFQPQSLRDDSVLDRLAGAAPDVFIVAAYGQIIPGRILDLAKRGSLNVHASLLPRWRGASPINAAILAGDDETGVSIMEVVRRMDAGPVVASRPTPITSADTAGSLDTRLSDLGAEVLLETFPGWYEGSLTAVPQDETAATYCSLIAKRDGHLRTSMTVDEAERAVRAYDPWPGAFVGYRGQRLAIWKSSIHRGDSSPGEPGSLAIIDRQPAIAFAGGLLVLQEVQREGSRRVDGASFINGERAGLPQQVELAS